MTGIDFKGSQESERGGRCHIKGYFNLLPMKTDGGELLRKSSSSNFLVLKKMISSLFILLICFLGL